jgi:hypothetical protein
VGGEDQWLLQGGDAYFHRDELDPVRARCTPGLRLYQRLMEKKRRARLWNQGRLRVLRREHGAAVTIVCGHDPIAFERLAGRPLREPPRARPIVFPIAEPELTVP